MKNHVIDLIDYKNKKIPKGNDSRFFLLEHCREIMNHVYETGRDGLVSLDYEERYRLRMAIKSLRHMLDKEFYIGLQGDGKDSERITKALSETCMEIINPDKENL